MLQPEIAAMIKIVREVILKSRRWLMTFEIINTLYTIDSGPSEFCLISYHV